MGILSGLWWARKLWRAQSGAKLRSCGRGCGRERLDQRFAGCEGQFPGLSRRVPKLSEASRRGVEKTTQWPAIRMKAPLQLLRWLGRLDVGSNSGWRERRVRILHRLSAACDLHQDAAAGALIPSEQAVPLHNWPSATALLGGRHRYLHNPSAPLDRTTK